LTDTRPNSGRRVQPATEIYRQVVWEIRKHIRLSGMTMQDCDDKSGLNDGHVAHMLHPDTAHGRQAKWETLQTLLEAVFPDGFRIKINPIQTGASRVRGKVDLRPHAIGKTPIRDLAIEMASRGGRAYAEKTPPEKRKKIARNAALVRWRNDPIHRRQKASKIARMGALARWGKPVPVKRQNKLKRGK
jgi:hypothetical protein